MRLTLIYAALAAAFSPQMAVPTGGGARDVPETIELGVTNNGDRELVVIGGDEDVTLKPGQTESVKLTDVAGFGISHGDDTDDDERNARGEAGRAKVEIANRSSAVLNLVADGTAHAINPGTSLSLTVADLDTLEISDASAVAKESVGAQAGSLEPPSGEEQSNQHRAGPEGAPGPDTEGEEVKGGYHDDAGKGPGSPDFPGQRT